jgi:hypothetical protein
MDYTLSISYDTYISLHENFKDKWDNIIFILLNKLDYKDEDLSELLLILNTFKNEEIEENRANFTSLILKKELRKLVEKKYNQSYIVILQKWYDKFSKYCFQSYSEEGYDFSWDFKDFKDEEELKLSHSETIFNIYACPHHFKIKKGHLSDCDMSNLEYICAIASGGYYYIKTELTKPIWN